MTIQNRVTIAEAAGGLARLIELLRDGEEVVLVKDGVEVARIIAPTSPGSAEDNSDTKQAWRIPGALAGTFTEIDPDWWKPDDQMADLFEGSDSFEGARGHWGKLPE